MNSAPFLSRIMPGLFAVLAAGQLAAAALHSAIDPAPRTDGWWKERQAQINQKVKEAGRDAKVLFIGDSITQGWEGEGKDVWANFYAPRKAVNLGIGGDRTQHVLWRLDNGNLDGVEPKVAVVMIGTNNSNGEDNTPGQIADGIAAIVAKLRQKLPNTHVLLLGIFPRSENFSAQRGKLLQINQVVQKLADDKWVHWQDIGHLMVNADGTIPRELMPDYLHLSPKGYDIWARAIEPKLAALIGDAPAARAQTSSATGLVGSWIWKIRGPDGNPVEAPLILEVNGTTITGKFRRGPEGWLPIQMGALNGDRFSWVVKRDRPGGGEMSYAMSGQLVDGAIKGEAKTQFDGQERTVEWSARRPKAGEATN